MEKDDSYMEHLSDEMKIVVKNLDRIGQIAIDEALKYHREQAFARKVFGEAIHEMMKLSGRAPKEDDSEK